MKLPIDELEQIARGICEALHENPDAIQYDWPSSFDPKKVLPQGEPQDMEYWDLDDDALYVNYKHWRDFVDAARAALNVAAEVGAVKLAA